MRVPVLCYHRIETPPASAPLDSNFVSPALFGEHMSMLSALGFTGVTVRDIAAWQHGQRTLPPRPIAITFDDAYESVVREAIPRLSEYKWPSTVYVVTSCIGGTNAWDLAAPPATLLDASALRTLSAQGHEIGSHSRLHRRIRGLSTEDASSELAGSRIELEAYLQAEVTTFAFPYGSHDQRALDAVRAAGYLAACTLKRWANGRHGNALRLGRMSVGGRLPSWQLAAKLLKMFVAPSFS